MKRINFKSDFELIYTLLDNTGQPLPIPDHKWRLLLSIGNPLNGACSCGSGSTHRYVASFDGTNYHNCEVEGNTIRVFADRHGLSCGTLWTTFVDYKPNSNFPDGDERIYTPQPTDVELVATAGDAPTETDIAILANYVVFEHEYTAGQGITIENDVISATGESYTAGDGINIEDGTISVSTGITDELSQHDDDIAQLTRDVASLNGDTVPSNPALRQSDTTTSGEVGKVVKTSQSESGNRSVITSDVFKSKFLEDEGGSLWCLPDASVETKAAADGVLVSSTELASKADASTVADLALDVAADELNISNLTTRMGAAEDAISTKASEGDLASLRERVTADETTLASKADQSDVTALGNRVSTIEGDYVTDTELAPISQDVNTLTTNYNSIVNALNQEITELIAGKAMMAAALTDRGYPTASTDSSASMAQKIENMAYDAGWLAQLGYTEQNDGGVKDAVAYSKAIKDGWDATATSRRFTTDKDLVYFPAVDTSQFTSFADMFKNCTSLMSIVSFNANSATNVGSMFNGCTALRYVPKLDTSLCTGFTSLFYNCTSLKRVEEISAAACNSNNSFNATFFGCTKLEYMLIKGLGTQSAVTSINLTSSSGVIPWGLHTEENRQSLVDTLLTYSYDRATANYSACTIKLHADTLARLTAEEIAAITAKGFTLTS